MHLNGHLPIVQYFLEQQNIEIDNKNRYEKTPLYYASQKGYFPTDIVKYLVYKGENKYIKDKDGQTPYDLTNKDEIRNILR